jgi:hypothetical protein
VAGTARDRAPSHDGGYMWLYLLKNGKSLEWRLGRATREKCRILDENVSEWNVFMFGAPKVLPKSVKGRSFGPIEQA